MCASNHPRKEASHRWRDPSPSCAAQDDTALRHRAGQACWNEIANSFSQIELLHSSQITYHHSISAMTIGIPKEIKEQEKRVGLIPSTTHKLVGNDHIIIVE